MLTLVRSPSGGQESTRPSYRRRYPSIAPKLTRAQQERVRALLRNLRSAYGSWSCLAVVMGSTAGSLAATASNPVRASLPLIHRLANAAGMTVEAVLATGLASVDTCPTCGARKGTR